MRRDGRAFRHLKRGIERDLMPQVEPEHRILLAPVVADEGDGRA